MTPPIELYPDDLVDKERAGTLTSDESRALRAHRARATESAFERLVRVDFQAELDSPVPDGAVDRLMAGMPATTAPRVRLRRVRGFLVAAVMLAATGAAASYIAHYAATRSAEETVLPTVHRPEPTPAPPARPRRGNAAPAPALPPEPVVAPPEQAEIETPAIAAPTHPRPGNESQRAAELFASANEARRLGNYTRASRLYRELVGELPESREATTARVTYGRVLLDRLGAAAEALRQFDAYLRKELNGPLSEEARLGRALALGSLGRRADERSAWQELLENHPRTPSAERAHRRIAELSAN